MAEGLRPATLKPPEAPNGPESVWVYGGEVFPSLATVADRLHARGSPALALTIRGASVPATACGALAHGSACPAPGGAVHPGIPEARYAVTFGGWA